jgi:hypothetical protein
MDLNEYQKVGRLNLDGFIDLNKSAIPYNEFVEKYVQSGKYEVYTEKAIADFQKSIQNDLVKSVIDGKGLKKLNAELSELNRVEYRHNDVVISVLVKEKIEKSAEAEEDVDEDDLQKGLVTDSFQYDSKMDFIKTGKDIKAQVNGVLIPLLEAQKTRLNADLVSKAKDIDCDPDSTVDSYEYRGFAGVLPQVAQYSWDMYGKKYDSNGMSTEACDEDQAKCMRKYNEIARNLVSTMSDIYYSSLLARNMEDSKKYTLTTKQVIALQF